MSWLTVSGGRYPASSVIEVLTPMMSEARISRFNEVLKHRITSISLGLEDLHHEHNGAACLRTAECFGIHRVMAAETRNAYPIPRTISMSAHQWLDIEKYSSGVDMIRSVQQQGMKVFGAGPRGTYKLEDIPINDPVLILFGNEADGLLDETMDACDEVFRIPMYGFTESLNLSVSVGIVLQQLTHRKRHQLLQSGIEGELDQSERDALFLKWIVRDFKNIEVILKGLLGVPQPID